MRKYYYYECFKKKCFHQISADYSDPPKNFITCNCGDDQIKTEISETGLIECPKLDSEIEEEDK